MPNGKSQSKGKRGELDLTHRLPGAKRIGHTFIKSLIDITWEGNNVAQVKNTQVGSTTIANILDELAKVAPESRIWLIFKAKRGDWVICQTLEQYLKKYREMT